VTKTMLNQIIAFSRFTL